MHVELPNQFRLRQLEETIRVLEREQVELISVPVPDFDDGDPADIVHDFQRVRYLSQQKQRGESSYSQPFFLLIIIFNIYFDIVEQTASLLSFHYIHMLNAQIIELEKNTHTHTHINTCTSTYIHMQIPAFRPSL